MRGPENLHAAVRHGAVHAVERFLAGNWPFIVTPILAAALCWAATTSRSLKMQCQSLQKTRAALTDITLRQAVEAFNDGDFRKADLLTSELQPAEGDDEGFRTLRCRILECTGQFKEAAAGYNLLRAGNHPPPDLMEAISFCRRMSTERNASATLDREILYRLHQSLLKRGLVEEALAIARQLLPDQQPLRDSIEPLLQSADPNATMEVEEDEERVDLTMSTATPAVIDLLRGLRIGSLTIANVDSVDLSSLAGLEVLSLNLNHSTVRNISAIKNLPLLALNVSDTDFSSLKALGGAQIKELDISHSKVSSLYPLILSPLETLRASGLPIRDISPLRALPLGDLDLSMSLVEDVSALSSMPLRILDLHGTRVDDLEPLANSQLRVLNLRDTPIRNVAPLSGLPLVELDLRGCDRLADLSPLLNCRKLETLYLPKRLRIPAAFFNLPRLKFIYHE